MYEIRVFERKAGELHARGLTGGYVHLCIGQEAIAVGVSEAMRRDDFVFSTYRNHGIYLARGGDPKKLLLELIGDVRGCSGGKGGSMHVVCGEIGLVWTGAIVAGHLPLAVGFAKALKMKRSDSVVVAFAGDGAMDEGVFWESLNLAKLYSVPLMFVIENNRYAAHLSLRRHLSIRDLVGVLDKWGYSCIGCSVMMSRRCILVPWSVWIGLGLASLRSCCVIRIGFMVISA